MNGSEQEPTGLPADPGGAYPLLTIGYGARSLEEFISIDEDGALLTQTQVIDRLTKGQMDLFGQASFTSRKRYGPRLDEELET